MKEDLRMPEGTQKFCNWLLDRVHNTVEQLERLDEVYFEQILHTMDRDMGNTRYHPAWGLIMMIMAMLRSELVNGATILRIAKSLQEYGMYNEVLNDNECSRILSSFTRTLGYGGSEELRYIPPDLQSGTLSFEWRERFLMQVIQCLHPRTRDEFVYKLHPHILSLLCIPTHTSWRIFVDLQHEDGSTEPFPRYDEDISMDTLSGRHEILRGKGGRNPVETDLHIRANAAGSCTVMQLFDRLQADVPGTHVRLRMCIWKAGKPELVDCGPFEPWGHIANHCRDLFLDESAVKEIISKVRKITKREEEAPLRVLPDQGIQQAVRPTITVYATGQWDLTPITG